MANDFTFAAPPSPEELAGYDLNDLGNAYRLMRLAGCRRREDGTWDTSGSTLLFLFGSGWIAFDGRRWDRTHGDDLARALAHRVAQQLCAANILPMMVEVGIGFKDAQTFIRRSGSAGATGAMLAQAQSYLTVEIDAFDREPLAINCLNGTLRLRAGPGGLERRLDPHQARDRLTKISGVAWNEAAEAPLFRRTHGDSFPDAGEGAYFHRACGYGATGLTREQAFFVCQGKGRDGKSTLIDAVRKALGGYAETGDVQTFLEGAQADSRGPSPDLARLSGDVRFVVLSEPKRGAAWNEARLKPWTSGSPVTARDLNAKLFSFKPVGKLFVECNPFPKPRGDDDGFWRRIKPVLFRRQVPVEEADLELPDKIEAGELEGVLVWLVDGIEDWLCGEGCDRPLGAGGGLRAPASLQGVVDEYRRQSSPFADWLAECCVLDPTADESMKELHDSFRTWAEAQGIEKPHSQT